MVLNVNFNPNALSQQGAVNEETQAGVVVFHPLGAETVSNNTDYANVEAYNAALFLLRITAASGTTPTLDIKVQTSDDATNWFDTGDSFAQKTAAGSTSLKVSNFGKYVRLVFTIGGTTPSFTFQLDGEFSHT